MVIIVSMYVVDGAANHELTRRPARVLIESLVSVKLLLSKRHHAVALKSQAAGFAKR